MLSGSDGQLSSQLTVVVLAKKNGYGGTTTTYSTRGHFSVSQAPRE
jgi:hypothetical protein